MASKVKAKTSQKPKMLILILTLTILLVHYLFFPQIGLNILYLVLILAVPLAITVLVKRYLSDYKSTKNNAMLQIVFALYLVIIAVLLYFAISPYPNYGFDTYIFPIPQLLIYLFLATLAIDLCLVFLGMRETLAYFFIAAIISSSLFVLAESYALSTSLNPTGVYGSIAGSFNILSSLLLPLIAGAIMLPIVLAVASKVLLKKS